MDRRRLSTSRGLDRFIPHRPSLDVNVSHARLMSCSSVCTDEVPKQYQNMNTKRYRRLVSDALHITDGKILPMTSTPDKSGPFTSRQNTVSPTSPDEGYYSPGRENRRKIQTSPECIMDMPGLRDDFYTNLLDWNSQNLLAVALSQSIYVWNAATKECQKIRIHCSESDHLPENLYVSALSWSPRDQYLAVADSYGDISVFDIEKRTHLDTLCNQVHSQACSVGALQWTEYGLASGNRKGAVNIIDMCSSSKTGIRQLKMHDKEVHVCGLKPWPGTSYLAAGEDNGRVSIFFTCTGDFLCGNRKGAVNIMDMRSPSKTGVRQLKTHGKEVCGLKLCPGTPYLAAGEDNGRVSIWDLRMSQLFSLKAHTACAKALAWCPWRTSILATGGGSSDGHIRIWHIHTGEKRAEVNTKSQQWFNTAVALSRVKNEVCSLLWPGDYGELVSSHGSTTPENNDIFLWGMRRMYEFEPVARLRQHMARPLHLALSPDKTTIASAGADEALCLWKCFPKQASSKSKLNMSPLNMFHYIR